MINEYKTENLRDALKIIKLIDSHDHFSVNGLIKSTTFESKVMNNVLNLLLESNLITIRDDDKIILLKMLLISSALIKIRPIIGYTRIIFSFYKSALYARNIQWN